MSPDASPIVWRPDPEIAQRTRVAALMREVGVADFETLHRWSIEDVTRFWDVALEDLGIQWYAPYETTLDASRGFPWARWFVGGKTNLVLNCLDRHVTAGRGAESALLGEYDDGAVRDLSYAELQDLTRRAAGCLRDLGVQEGQRVGLYMPMGIEVVAALFACFQVGAVAVPVFSAFGVEALGVRLKDAEAVAVFTADGGFRRGKPAAIKPRLDEALRMAPSVESVIVLRRTGEPVAMEDGRDHWWHEAVEAGEPDDNTAVLDAEAPAMVLYTSGTTGKPKGTIHTHAGCLAQITKEVGYAFDVHPGDRLFWLSDIGWMMGPWSMIGTTCLGATLLVFEGAPNWPQPDRLFEMVARHRLTHLGVAPTAIRLLRTAGDDVAKAHDLSTLRILGSTGEPWDPDAWTWFLNEVGGGRCPVINISGGTELVGCHLSPLPTTSLKPCTLRGPGLGMDVDVFDDEGRPVREGIGHLVLKQPAPSLTKSFLGDDERYLETYFTRFGDEVWYHGDWALIDADGFWFLHGRSDDTMNIAGKRVGPAEVEAAAIAHEAASEAAAIGVPDPIKGETVVVFVVLAPGWEENEPLRRALSDAVVRVLGKAFRPKDVRFVDALPKTRSAKIMRSAIRKRWLGEVVGEVQSLENPQALESIPDAR